jgi:hypothetical protein
MTIKLNENKPYIEGGATAFFDQLVHNMISRTEQLIRIAVSIKP